MRELKERASQNRFPEIPRRQYERKHETDLSNEREERHVRSRHHLQPDIAGLRLHREEKALLGEAGRFRVLSIKDAAGSLYAGDDRALRSDLRFLKERGLVSVDIVNARRDGRSRSVERIEVITLIYAADIPPCWRTKQLQQRTYQGANLITPSSDFQRTALKTQSK